MERADTPALLMLDLPASALAGIDLLSFTVTPRFRGVKELPRGFHFAFAGTSTAFSERHGLWFAVPSTGPTPTPAALTVLRWSSAAESLQVETDESERLRWRANLGSIWREGLTPYRQTTSKKTVAEEDNDDEEEANDWPSLVSTITDKLLSRVTGGDSNHWYLTSASSAKCDLEDIPGLNGRDLEELQADKELNLIPLNLKQTWRDGATGRERTDAAQDRSWALENVVKNHCTDGNVEEIIGELQFCFLMVLTLNNFSCFEQWKRILTLILTCKDAIPARPEFFIKALAAIRLQLRHCKDAEGGLIDLADEGGSLLKHLLVRFRKGLESVTGSGILDVVEELDDLEEYLRKDHGWQFGGSFARSGILELEDGEQVQMESNAFDEDDETGEFAPQIVDLTPEQARLLNITPEDAHELGLGLSKASLRDDREVADVVQDSDGSSGQESEDEDLQDLDEMDSRF